MRPFLALLTLTAAVSSAAVIDRVALVVGKAVFTQSEIDDEVRLSEMEGGKPLDLSAAARKAAAERMVDQQLLRDEMAATAFELSKGDAAALLAQFRQQHYRIATQYQAALANYGITESQLKDHLAWEVTVVQFTDQRFKPFTVPFDDQTADRSIADVKPKPKTPEDDPMALWLKQQRAATKIVFKQEAFQ
jgi:hypothetical protein